MENKPKPKLTLCLLGSSLSLNLRKPALISPLFYTYFLHSIRFQHLYGCLLDPECCTQLAKQPITSSIKRICYLCLINFTTACSTLWESNLPSPGQNCARLKLSQMTLLTNKQRRSAEVMVSSIS